MIKKLPRVKNAKITLVDGIKFHSRKEALRYCALKLLKLAGTISDLKLQPKFPIVINGIKVFSYHGDFLYRYFTLAEGEGPLICEDVKGYRTDIYKLKIKAAKAAYPQVQFIET